MIFKKGISIFIIFLILLTACSKPEKAPLPQNLLQLTNGTYKDWRLEQVNYAVLNVTNQIPSCQRDEIYRFYADGRGEIISGPMPCPPKTPDATEPDVQAMGTWEFVGNGEEIIVNWKDKKNWEATVNELTDSKLVVTGVIFDNFVVTATFKPL